jgi:hypothetical protein
MRGNALLLQVAVPNDLTAVSIPSFITVAFSHIQQD